MRCARAARPQYARSAGSHVDQVGTQAAVTCGDGTMATALQEQLGQLALARGAPGDRRPKGRPSLLFDPLEAADIDAATILEISGAGLEQLCRLDARFEPCAARLFSRASLSTHRTQMTAAENAQLDRAIEDFLHLLSGFFLTQACFKVLEFCVRQYAIHEHNVPTLVACALPYHQTNEFVKVLQLCSLEGTVFAFLRPSKESGAPPPREPLARRCCSDGAFLNAVCAEAQALGGRRLACPTFMSFYAVLLCEALMLAPAVDARLASLLLPHLAAGMGREATSEFRAATFMVLGVLLKRTELDGSVAADLLELVCLCPEEALYGQAVALAALLVATQPAVASLPPACTRSLANIPDLPGELTALADAGADVGRLVALVVDAMAEEPRVHAAALLGLVRCAPLSSDVAATLASALLRAVESGQEAGAAAKDLKLIVQALDRRYPAAVDASVTEHLTSSKGQNKRLKAFLGDVLHATPRAIVPEAALTLLHAVDAPAAGVRIAALEQLDAALAAPAGDEDARAELLAFAREALLRRIADDEPDVVEAALASDVLRDAPQEAVCAALEGALASRADALARKPRKGDEAAQQIADDVRCAVALTAALGKRLACQSGPDSGVAELLGLLVVPAGSSLAQVAAAATEAAQGTKHPLFALVGGGARKGRAGSKQAKAEEPDAARASEGRLRGVAAAVARDPETLAPLVAGLAGAARRVHALAAAAIALGMAAVACGQQSGALACAKAAADLALQHVEYVSEALEVGQDGLPATVCLWDDAVPPTFWRVLRKRPRVAVGTALRDGLLAALAAAAGAGDAHLASRVLSGLAAVTAHDGGAARMIFEAAVDVAGGVPGEFLSKIFTAEDAPPEAAAAALGALTVSLAAPSGQDTPSALFALQLVSACGAASKRVRKAAASAAGACASCQTSCAAIAKASHLTAAQVKHVLEAVGSHRSHFGADRGYVEVLLDNALLGSSTKTGARGRGRGKQQAQGVAQALLPAGTAAALLEYLTRCVQQCQLDASECGPTSLALTVLGRHVAQPQLLQAALPLLGRLAEAGEAAGAREVRRLGVQLLSDVLVEDALVGVDAGQVQDAAGSLLRLLSTEAGPAPADLRAAAASALRPGVLACLPAGLRREAVSRALFMADHDANEGAAAAARKAVENAPLTGELLASIMLGDGAAAAAPPSRKKRAASAPAATVRPAAVLDDAIAWQRAQAVLELLQWRDGIEQPRALLDPLIGLAKELVAAVERLNAGSDAGSDAGESAGASVAVAAYGLQLVLSALDRLVASERSLAQATDVDLIVSCAGGGPNAACRAAALSLLASLASAAPEQVSSRAIELLAAVSGSFAADGGVRVQGAAATVLRAIVPAWQADQRPMRDLVAGFASALPQAPASRRVPLLTALLEAAPGREVLAAVVLQVLAAALDAGSPQQPDEGLIDALTDVCRAAPAADRIAALADALELAARDVGHELHQPLHVACIAFVADLMGGPRATRLSLPASEATSEAQDAYRSLLEALLSDLRSVGPQLATAVREGRNARSRALEAASDSLYAALDALQGRMDPEAHLAALSELCAHEDPGVARTAFRLTAQRISSLDLAEDPLVTLLTGDERAEKERNVLLAALRAVEPAAALLAAADDPSGALAAQSALVALDSLAKACGEDFAAELCVAVPAISACLAREQRGVRASAMVTIASLATALGVKLLGHLPQLSSVLLDTVEAALRTFALRPSDSPPDAEEDGGDSEEDGPSPGLDKDTVELELASGISACGAIVEGMGAFCSPFLGRILAIVLSPALLQDDQDGVCAEAAEAVRNTLCDVSVVPPRLIVPALISRLEACVAEGADSTAKLLGMFAATSKAMQPKTAAEHHDALFVALLKALDVRRRRPAGIADRAQIEKVEQAAVAAVVALIMKLSEALFKPLFLRLVDWTGMSSRGTEGADTARMATAFAVVSALGGRMRTVLVPYFRYVGDAIVSVLAGNAHLKEKRSKKKRKAATPAPDRDCNDDLWLLRFRVLAALHRCLQYDSGVFLDQDRFSALAPAVVAQLDQEPPAHLLQEACFDDPVFAAIEDSGPFAAGDAYGVAVAECLAQLAVTAGSDVVWKPLHQQVLMATRSPSARTKLLALAALGQLVQRVREEYLVLLPESLPFLSELMEDSDVRVEARAHDLVRELEALAGEDLSQYYK
ncbi:unnamed protein product [Pedinophyceae sp. YPF-701]|nr:unnamed protein product [Pedinophyceae sp. YPF-701]